MMIALIACSAAKLPSPAPARDLYQGQLFRAARAWAEAHADAWYILSALHHVLDPAEVVEPYNLSLADVAAGRKEPARTQSPLGLPPGGPQIRSPRPLDTWAITCRGQLMGSRHDLPRGALVRRCDRVVMLAGRLYVERDGRVRSQVAEMVNGKEITKILKRHVATTAVLNTDESGIYTQVGKEFAAHDTVNHKSEEYARQDKATGRLATTNAAEGFFGNSKRSLDGTHHHISKGHTGLYFAELDYKYNTRKMSDGVRTNAGIVKMEGKRLMLRRPKGLEE